MLAAIGAAAERLRLYPDPRATVLREAIAARYGVAPEEVFVGNGSDEVLAHTFQALLKHDAPLLFPDITYSFYPVYCGLYGIATRRCRSMPRCGCRSPTTAGRAAPSSCPIRTRPPASACRARRSRRCVAEHPDQLVVIDEAYVDFGAESAVPLVARHDNLLVVQTLSKSRALAGLRVGFAIGQRPLIEALERVKDSFNSYPLDCLAIVGRGRGDRGRRMVSGDARAHHGEPRIAGRARFPGSASRFCRRRRISSSRAIPAAAARSLPHGCASAAFWCGISRSRASRISCASRLERTSNAAV